jgi:hypothetical protein
MLKYSIATLFVAISLVGVACAALVNASELWLRFTTTVVAVVLAMAVLVVVVGQGEIRTFATGVVIFGAAYYVFEEVDALLTESALAEIYTLYTGNDTDVKDPFGASDEFSWYLFRKIGHNLWALAFAFAGGVLALLIRRRNHRLEATATADARPGTS